MKKITVVNYVLLVAIVAFVIFAPLGFDRVLVKKEEATPKKIILSLWHVDSFEGGTGSRQDFLMKSAIDFEKLGDGVIVSVIKHTEESVAEGLKAGQRPDLISFGIGVDGVAEIAKPLKSHVNNVFFNSASVGSENLYIPYAYGKYFKFTNPNAKKQGRVTAVGKNNLPLFALKKAGEEVGETMTPIEAYTAFVGGSFSELIGTQRDAYRLIRRGVDFSVEGVGSFTDLVQYVAVTASEKDRVKKAESFARYLISPEVQARLKEIGLFSPTGEDVDYAEGKINELKGVKIDSVLSGLVGSEQRIELKHNDGQNNFFEKFDNFLVV